MIWLSSCNIANKDNNLTLIRLLAASAVVLGHSLILNTGIKASVFGLFSSGYLGFLAVAVFFALSGFLITQSYERRAEWLVFLESRVLRIFPGLIFSAILTVLLVWIFGSHDLSFKTATHFVVKTIGFGFDSLDDYFKTNPLNGVNGSIWTLGIEFWYYILVLLLGLCGVFKRPILFVLFLTFFIVSLAIPVPVVLHRVFRASNFDSTYLSLPICFFFGSCFYVFRQRIPLHFGIVLILALLAPVHWVFLVFTFSYAAFYFGFHPRFYLKKLRNMDDVSYGVYILAFPIQQLIVMRSRPLSGLELMALSYPLTVCAAWISWRLIERPALSLKGYRPFAKLKRV